MLWVMLTQFQEYLCCTSSFRILQGKLGTYGRLVGAFLSQTCWNPRLKITITEFYTNFDILATQSDCFSNRHAISNTKFKTIQKPSKALIKAPHSNIISKTKNIKWHWKVKNIQEISIIFWYLLQNIKLFS